VGKPFHRRRLLSAAFALAACSRPKALPVFQTVPPFQLTSQDGLPFSSERLAGAPWLASFFFASCNGPCPRINSLIAALQEKTYPFKGLKIISFTVDPVHDTPAILAAYARRFKADPERWFFLTGPQTTIDALANDAFQVGASATAQSHSTRIMLIDSRFRVRGHFPTSENQHFDELFASVKSLYEERH
jgi:cytochrome oxidase Cu insertion factor (SCO1/SenC/PrrC family)